MLKTGTEAPDFTATTESGEAFRLSEWRGRKHVILYFFAKAFTRG